MSVLLTIGEFSRMTHLSVKALRHYDDVGLLTPAQVDRSSGYRRYATGQVPIAQVIRRFRDLDMPLDEIRSVLNAPDVAVRDQAVLVHLQRMQETLAQTRATVASLQALLDGNRPTLPVEYRSVPAFHAVGIRGIVDWDDAEPWLNEALADLDRTVDPRSSGRTGPDSALYSGEFFEAHVGEVTAFVPVRDGIATAGRVEHVEIPAADVAVLVHSGPFSDLDQAYGTLGTFVAERVLAVDGPIREHYLATEDDTDDPAAYRTEVCWPIRADAARATRT
ncbi:MAG TPA: MerR family transcriptional regulator [Acidimicrobiia bacterium]|jgi:DNA-binding transcriptional MerR regulator